MKVNEFAETKKFEMTNIPRWLRNIPFKPNWLASMDVKNGFHNIEIDDFSKRQFGFQYNGQTFIYNRLPFGFTTSPYYFCTIMREILESIDFGNGVFVTHYMDDILIASVSRNGVERSVTKLVSKFQEIGWLLNKEKSHLRPTKRIEFLGLVINCEEDVITLEVNDANKEKTIEDIEKGKFQKVVRRFSYLWQASRIYYAFLRPLYKKIKNNDRFNNKDINNLRKFISLVVRIVGKPEEMIAIDATLSKIGIFVESSNKMIVFEHPSDNIAENEMLALKYALGLTSKQRIIVFTDNKNVYDSFESGRGKAVNLGKIAYDIARMIAKNQQAIKVEWIGTKKNSIADMLSRNEVPNVSEIQYFLQDYSYKS